MSLLDMEAGGPILLDHYTFYRSLRASEIVRASRFLFCHQVQLHEAEVVIESGRLHLPNSELTLYPSMYRRDSQLGRVHVCLTDYLNATKKGGMYKKKQSTVSRMVSVAFSCVSIFCLVAALVAIFCFPGLHTLFGKVSFAFLCHLLLAQILTVSALNVDGNASPGLCAALGIAVHVSWLATAAMNTVFCTRPYVHRLLQVPLVQPLTVRCRFVILTLLICYLPALLLPGLTVGLSLYLSDGVDVGYGVHHCSVDSVLLLSCLCLAPLILSFLACCVLGCVSRASATTGNEGNQSFAWPSIQLGVCYTLVWISWFLEVLGEHIAYEIMFWMFNTTLCFVAFFVFVVKPKIQANETRNLSET